MVSAKKICCVLALLFLAHMAIEAQAVTTISGTVTNANTSLGIAGIDLDVFDAATGLSVAATGARSGANGIYTITLPGPGTYTIRTDATRGDGFVDQYYGGVFLPSQATPLAVALDEQRTGIDFQLRPGFEIRGQVTANAAGVGGIDLDVYASTGEFLSGYPATTAADGTYAIGALPPGPYYVRVDPDPAKGQWYLQTYYSGKFSLSTATSITIAVGDVTGINFALTPGGTIKGRVLDGATSLPIARIDLDLYDSLGARMPQNVITSTTGSYEIGPVPTGNYTLRADPTIAQGYPRTYYASTYRHLDAQRIAVAAGAATGGIDFVLPRAGSISGRMTDAATSAVLAGIDLDIYNSKLQRLDVTAKTGVDGTYQLGPLAPGTYFVAAGPTPAQQYAREFYFDRIDINIAHPVAVTANATTPNINFALALGGFIRGTIRDAASQPLTDIDLDLFEAATGNRLRAGAKTAPDGTFALESLPAGQYVLRADPTTTQGFAVQYYSGKISRGTATIITVAAGAGLANADFTLQQAGSIAGNVSYPRNGGPAVGVDLDIYQAVTMARLDQTARSDVNGNFVLSALPPGSYIIRAQPPAGVPYYAQTYYLGALRQDQATPIAVAAGQNAAGKNIVFLEVRLGVQRWNLYR